MQPVANAIKVEFIGSSKGHDEESILLICRKRVIYRPRRQFFEEDVIGFP